MAAESKLISVRKDFPILSRKVNGKLLAYLDNAATSQKPRQVIKALADYYENYNANVHRGIHTLSEEATGAYEDAHRKTAKFIGSKFEETVFTKNTTESINLLAYSLSGKIGPGDEILLTEMEHHSNLVPWQQIAMKRKAKVIFAKVDSEGKIDFDDFNSKLSSRTKIVSAVHVSNVLGTINPAKEMAKAVHEKGALFVLDAAQSVPHMPVDAKNLDCDFMAFSSHKMLGPTGIGVLYGRKDLLSEMQPFLYGGDMIREVSYEQSRFSELPWKFEAGTPNIADGIAFGVAVDYLSKFGMDQVKAHEDELTSYAMEKLLGEKDITIYGPKERAGVVSFNIDGIHAHDVAAVLDQEGVAIRAGHHCAMPLSTKLGIMGSCRASFYIYNTKQEIDKMIAAIAKSRAVFK